MSKELIILAVFSFVKGASVFSVMVYILTLKEQFQTNEYKSSVSVSQKNVSSHHSHHAFGLHLDKTSFELIVVFVILISFMTMVFSILLVIGIKKNKPSLVVAYFSFGCLLCMLLLVSAVLELLQSFWYAAIITIIVAFIMMEGLSVVYSFYENMEKECDTNLLLEEDEFNDQEHIDNIISE